MPNEPRLMLSSPIPLRTPDRRLFLLSAAGFVLTGCSGLIGPPPASPIYVLRADTAPAPVAPGPKVAWALSIVRPDSSDSLNTDRIALTRPDNTLDYYANSVWPDRLPVMVETALLASFEASGRIDAVSRDADTMHADYVLSTEIRDFAAHYDTPDGPPKVTVALVVHIDRAHGRNILANFTTTQSQQASANSVGAAVQAFDAALSAAVAAIAGWVLSVPPPAAVAK